MLHGKEGYSIGLVLSSSFRYPLISLFEVGGTFLPYDLTNYVKLPAYGMLVHVYLVCEA